MSKILFTGFPGFLGSSLLPRVLARDPEASALCLVQSKFAGMAKSRADDLVAADRSLEGRISLVEGDLTEPGLGLDDTSATEGVSEIYHLAAVYDLSVAREVGIKVNVAGTRHVLDVAKRCDNLERLQYVSTCYVSGRHQGVFKETDLVAGQAFNNYYEETKYLAEVEVQAEMNAGMPATIYRPSIVVGDSRSGATQKFDGPYFVMQWLLRQPARFALMPVVGDPRQATLNVVPSDFVIDAITELSGREDTVGTVYALADPAPLTVDTLIDVLGEATGRRLVRIPLPLGLAKTAIEKVPGVFPLLRIPSDAVDYFVHPTTYDTTNTKAALGETLRCPPFESYVNRLVAFKRAHPEVGSEAMV